MGPSAWTVVILCLVLPDVTAKDLKSPPEGGTVNDLSSSDRQLTDKIPSIDLKTFRAVADDIRNLASFHSIQLRDMERVLQRLLSTNADTFRNQVLEEGAPYRTGHDIELPELPLAQNVEETRNDNSVAETSNERPSPLRQSFRGRLTPPLNETEDTALSRQKRSITEVALGAVAHYVGHLILDYVDEKLGEELSEKLSDEVEAVGGWNQLTRVALEFLGTQIKTLLGREMDKMEGQGDVPLKSLLSALEQDLTTMGTCSGCLPMWSLCAMLVSLVVHL